ncbi:MAG: PG0541 family transporter-associated protein [Treponema sp.]
MNYRIEIIANQSVQDDITELLEKEIADFEYTMLPVVHGSGKRAKKLGTAIWPEQNFALFAYVTEEDAQKIKTLTAAVKEKFPDEGISFFCTQGVEL